MESSPAFTCAQKFYFYAVKLLNWKWLTDSGCYRGWLSRRAVSYWGPFSLRALLPLNKGKLSIGKGRWDGKGTWECTVMFLEELNLFQYAFHKSIPPQKQALIANEGSILP